MTAALDFEIESIVLPRTELSSRPVPFPIISQAIVYARHSKKDVRTARSHLLPTKVPMAALHASQATVSPIGVERFVLLAMAGIAVPLPVVIHFNGMLIIFDGHHRATALYELGSDVLEVQLADMGGCIWR